MQDHKLLRHRQITFKTPSEGADRRLICENGRPEGLYAGDPPLRPPRISSISPAISGAGKITFGDPPAPKGLRGVIGEHSARGTRAIAQPEGAIGDR